MALQGQVALVLGGAGGIGIATAQELLQAGANVAICDVSAIAGLDAAKKFQKQFGINRCFFVQADVREDAKLDAAFVATKKHFTKLDIFINSAGILNDHDWELCMDINAKGVIRGTLLAWKHMGKHEGGRGGTIVNIASILGLTYIPSAPVYTATKHAVVGWGRACGTPFHLERTGVRVITMCPGVTDTSLIVPTDKPRELFPEIIPEMEKDIASLPFQTVDVVASAMLHLILHAPNGSVWVSEGGEEPYEVDIPERQHMRLIP